MYATGLKDGTHYEGIKQMKAARVRNILMLKHFFHIFKNRVFTILRRAILIEINHKLREACGDGVMNTKNVHSWVRKFKESRKSCDATAASPIFPESKTDFASSITL